MDERGPLHKAKRKGISTSTGSERALSGRISLELQHISDSWRPFNELVLSTTNRCTAHCRDCPVVPSDYPLRRMTLDEMKTVVDKVRALGSLHWVTFTGGESFLLGVELASAIQYVSSHGVCSRVVTNAYWATNPQRTSRWLAKLQESGLTEMQVSCDDYHQEYVPLANIRRVNDAAADLGIPLLIVHRSRPGGIITVPFLSDYLGVSLREWQAGGPNPPNHVITTVPNIPIRDGFRQARGVASRAYADARADGWQGPCGGVLQSIVVFPDLSVRICCGIAISGIPELTIGNIAESDLSTILERGFRDFVANWLALEGPSSMLEFVTAQMPDHTLPDRYVDPCHVCNTLLTREDTRAVLLAHAAQAALGFLHRRSEIEVSE